MASSPKITVTIPKALKISAEEREALKQAFNAAVVRVCKKQSKTTSADITNWGGSARGGSSRKGTKAKAGKKKAAASKKK